MELGSTYVVLAYISPVLGVIGFIITPGLTHIRPWLLERFNKNKEDAISKSLDQNYGTMSPIELLKEKINFEDNYKWDWRPKINKQKKALNAVIRHVTWKK